MAQREWLVIILQYMYTTQHANEFFVTNYDLNIAYKVLAKTKSRQQQNIQHSHSLKKTILHIIDKYCAIKCSIWWWRNVWDSSKTKRSATTQQATSIATPHDCKPGYVHVFTSWWERRSIHLVFGRVDCSGGLGQTTILFGQWRLPTQVPHTACRGCGKQCTSNQSVGWKYVHKVIHIWQLIWLWVDVFCYRNLISE